jgi:hypothetical protein
MEIRQFSNHPVPAREASGTGGGGIPQDMTFISYAQNYEDVMLWRALKDVSNGFWIDDGAAHLRDLSMPLPSRSGAGGGPATVLCCSFGHMLCSKGDEP